MEFLLIARSRQTKEWVPTVCATKKFFLNALVVASHTKWLHYDHREHEIQKILQKIKT
jgi:hypothetical protein